MIIKQSIDHLKENKMTYLQHFGFAFVHGIRCIKAGILLCFHSIIPGIFPQTGSVLINKLNESFIDHNEYIKYKKYTQQLKDDK